LSGAALARVELPEAAVTGAILVGTEVTAIDVADATLTATDLT
jgi:hypothetical protein